MNRDLRKHKRSDSIKWTVVFIAVIFLALAVAAALTQGFKESNPYCWFGHDYDEAGICTRCGAEKEDKNIVATNSESGFVASSTSANGIRLIRSPAEPMATSDVLAPEGSCVLTVSFEHDSAVDKTIDWSVRWYVASFGSGVVSDYVTVTPREDGGLVADVNCLQAFGNKIEVVATSRDNPNAYATCLCDYVQRITSLDVGGDNGIVTLDQYTFQVNYITSDYTLPCEKSYSIGKVVPSNSFCEFMSYHNPLFTYDGKAAEYLNGFCVNVPTCSVVSQSHYAGDFLKLVLSEPSDNWYNLGVYSPASSVHGREEFSTSSLGDGFEVLGDYDLQRYFGITTSSRYTATDYKKCLRSFYNYCSGKPIIYSVELNFTASYNGTVYSQGTILVPLTYGYNSSLVFDVGDVSFSDEHVLF